MSDWEFYKCTICGMYYLEFIDVEPRVCGSCLLKGSESGEENEKTSKD